MVSNQFQNSDDNYTSKRLEMVEHQIKRRGVTDEKALEAMRTVPRHLFISEELFSSAYKDSPLSIGYDQTISQPYVVASMTEELRIDAASRVLEIGTGCGYQTAVLAEIVREVYTIEIVPELAAGARQLLEQLGYDNIYYRVGNGIEGWTDKAPFDAIIVAAAAQAVPPPLIEQLKYGGRLVIPVERGSFGSQELILVVKEIDGINQTDLYPVRFVSLQEEE